MSTLRDYLIENYEHNELVDICNHGCVNGFTGLIYYSETVALFEKFKNDCFEILNNYRDETGENGFPDYISQNSSTYETFCNSVIWFCVEYLAYEITQGEYVE